MKLKLKSWSLGNWFLSKRIFLFDLDGTLYLGANVIGGACELIQKLRKENKTIFFFSQFYFDHLAKFQFRL
jgi:FMN phosphatase YigB (HAD superfamily)